jgi:hypothetical protein
MRAALLAWVALAGCAAEPVPYHSGNEIPRGPGLLTGAEGAFVLRTYAGAKPPEASTKPPEASVKPRNADEEREYQEWREWKQRQNQ